MQLSRSPIRIALIAVVALGLAPGTWLRTPLDTSTHMTGIAIESLAERGGVSGELEVTGAWVMHAPHPFFGGFSALVDARDEGLKLGSDRGWMLDLPLVNGDPDGAAARFGYYAERRNSFEEMIDLEAMARDPATGTLWTAYEAFNTIQRDDPDGSVVRRAPAEMTDWPDNSGPETMVRLGDGRFIVLGEASQRPHGDHPGLLFARDPVTDSAPMSFRFEAPPGFDPVDGTALPDGSVLILLRRVQYTVPATFDGAILRAYVADIAEDSVWTGEIVARFAGDVFGENFEGIAYLPGADGGADGGEGAIWLVADDNLSMFQRNLLVRLRWKSGTPAP